MAFHAVRNLARLGMGVVELNWMELGFGRTSTTSTAEATPRNLLGFKDGTRNIKAQDRPTSSTSTSGWARSRTRPGSAAAATWSPVGSGCSSRTGTVTTSATNRTSSAGPRPRGAPLTGGTEFTTPNFTAQDDQGQPVIPADAHIRLASHEENGGMRLLRRGYSYTDGIDPVRGTLLGGLFFIAFMKDPSQFITLQQKLGTNDALNEYIQHTGSALFACPPGITSGKHWGDGLFTGV